MENSNGMSSEIIYKRNRIGHFWYNLFRKEFIKLSGKGYRSIIGLTLIFLFIFIALGFISGTLTILKNRMQSPFVNWVTVTIPSEQDDNALNIRQYLNNDSLKKRWDYYNATLNKKVMLYLKDTNNKPKLLRGITIQTDAPILKEIFKKDRLIKGMPIRSKTDIGLVITDKVLNDLGYDTSNSYLFTLYKNLNEDDYIIRQLPIISIVKSLPDNADFIVTPYFYYLYALYDGSRSKPFNPVPFLQKRFSIFIYGNEENYEKFYRKANKIVLPFLKRYKAHRMLPKLDTLSFKKGYVLRYSFLRDSNGMLPSRELLDSVFYIISSDKKIKSSFKFFRYYGIRMAPPFNNDPDYIVSPSILSVNFEKLDSIEGFAHYLFKKYDGLEVTMERVDNAKNFLFVSGLAKTSMFLLIVFSLVTIMLLINSMLDFHIYKIRMNLGTFLAFGISQKNLIRVYLFVFATFLTVSSGIAYLISVFLGKTISKYLVYIVFKIFSNADGLNKNFSIGFDINNKMVFYVWIAVFLIGLIYSGIIIWRYLKNTPGDLIYDRIDKRKRNK